MANQNDDDEDRRPMAGRLQDVFNQSNPLLIRYIERIIQSREDAEEIVQDAYIRVLNSEKECNIEHLRSYLFKVAHNLAIDRIRASSRYNKYIGQLRDQTDPEAESSVAEQPEGELLAQELGHNLEQALTQLPEKCRQAFLLYRGEGKSYREIAQQMAVTESMVRKHVIRALLHLKDSIFERNH